VATVTQVIRRDFGIYQQVQATPAVDFSRLEEVLIVVSPPLDDSQASREAPGSSAPRR
jgi:rod shape-determining protein MreC